MPLTTKAQEYTEPYMIQASSIKSQLLNISTSKRVLSQIMSSPKTPLLENDLTLKLRNAESVFKDSVFSWVSVVYPTKLSFETFATSFPDADVRECVESMANYPPLFRMDGYHGFEKSFEIENREKLGSHAKRLIKFAVHERGDIDSDQLTEKVVMNWDKAEKMNEKLRLLELAEDDYLYAVKRSVEKGLKNAK